MHPIQNTGIAFPAPSASHTGTGRAVRKFAGGSPAEDTPPLQVIGWTYDNQLYREEILQRILKQKDVYEAMENRPWVYTFGRVDDGYDAQSAKAAFFGTFGRKFFDAISTVKQPSITEGDDMAYAVYDPKENAAFILSKYDHDGESGAKIFFDGGMNITRVEQKSVFGPFKNGGEYFMYVMRHAIQS